MNVRGHLVHSRSNRHTQSSTCTRSFSESVCLSVIQDFMYLYYTMPLTVCFGPTSTLKVVLWYTCILGRSSSGAIILNSCRTIFLMFFPGSLWIHFNFQVLSVCTWMRYMTMFRYMSICVGIVCQMLPWWMKNSPHSINIRNIATKGVSLCSVCQAPL